jgi:hypothetical protein
LSEALFIVLVGGCSPLGEVEVAVPVVADAPGVGPDPASLFAAVLQGPASEIPVLRSKAAQLVKRTDRTFIAGLRRLSDANNRSKKGRVPN